MVSAVPAVGPVIEVDAVFAVALGFVSASAIPKACNLAPRRAAAIHSGSDLVFLGEVFTFRADLGKRGLGGVLPTG